MENINNNKISSNQNDTIAINNYNNIIIDYSSKNYIFDVESLYRKLSTQKNKNENIIINEYHSNLLMLYLDDIKPVSKIFLLKLLFSFNSNPKDDNYKYYIFKKLTKILEELKQQEPTGINFNSIIDILIEQGKFFYEKNNNFYAYRSLCNGLYKDIPNIRNVRHKIKEQMFEDNKNIKEYFSQINKKDFKNILFKLNEMIKNDINSESNDIFYVINNTWLKNAIKFIQNIIESNKNLYDEFNLSNIFQYYFESSNYGEILYPHPGKVNNYIISDFKDIWKDPVKDDENYLLKDNISFIQDYSLVNENDWNFINELFGSTNEIKRYRNNLQLMKLKVVILDKRFIKEHINLLKPKYIQTKFNINIKEFKKKIFRCVNNTLKNLNENIDNKNNADKDIEMNDETDKSNRNIFLKNDNNNNNLKNIINIENENDECKINFNFFKLKKKNKPLLIEIFTAYIKDIFNYESTYIEKIEIKDENKLEDILNFFDKSNDILIIELFPHDSGPFLESLKYDTNGLYQCTTCQSKISFQEKYDCERCNFSIYCSKKCLESESQINITHNKLHEHLKEYQTKSGNNNLTNNNSNNLVGLMNLGNTCFINSSLQCLFHTKELTNYFLQNTFTKEINIKNSQGSKGQITEGFADLLKEMQSTNLPKLNPINFLKTFFRINKTLYAGMQHDAQEFLSILLDCLHEDLNRINKKPYIPLEEQKENEKDNEASDRFWNLYKKREDSIIVDLFHGQFKSKISCVECGNASINYDPYIFLGLPIPEIKNRMIIKLVFMNKLEYFGFDLTGKSSVFDLKKKAIEHMKMCGYNKDESNEVLYNCIEIVLMDENKIIKKIFDEKNKLNDNVLIFNILNDNKSLELVLYEKKLDNNYFNIYAYPIKQNDYESSLYPISLSVTGEMSFKEILLENKQKILNLYININEDENIKIGILHKKNDSWVYYFANMFDSREYCPVCKTNEGNYCLLNDNIKIGFLLKLLKNYTPILFTIGTPKKFIINKRMRINDNLDNGIYFLNDCLKLFCDEELLNKENMWYCNVCKKHKRAKKQIKLFRMPKYLIIQLKKFENKADFFNYMNEKKKDVFIKYPINNLDLSDFIENIEQKKYKYDLYAIIQHHGKINQGHYTAICNINDNWVLYNDSMLYKLDNPVTKDAYILFYKRNE